MIRSATIRGEHSVVLADHAAGPEDPPVASREGREALPRGEVQRLAPPGGRREDLVGALELPEDRPVRRLDGVKGPVDIADIDHAVGEQGFAREAGEPRRPSHRRVLRELAPRDRPRCRSGPPRKRVTAGGSSADRGVEAAPGTPAFGSSSAGCPHADGEPHENPVAAAPTTTAVKTRAGWIMAMVLSTSQRPLPTPAFARLPGEWKAGGRRRRIAIMGSSRVPDCRV